MAQDYEKVLQAQQTQNLVIGRGPESAATFLTKTGVAVKTGGLANWLEKKPDIPDAAIVAVGVDLLAPITTQLIEYGVKYILLEKPGGLGSEEIQELSQKANDHSAKVYIAYNRRFYSSTLQAQKMIEEDGGVTSFNFEFTEWGHVIEKLKTPEKVLNNWFLANSSHVVDLAFHLGGVPQEISCFTAGSLKWHPTASVFAGAGVSKNGALFSYQANWAAPGRWGVELQTSKRRYYFRPMEELHVQELGSVKVEKVAIDDSLDQNYKPGLYLQVKAFLGRDTEQLLSLDEQASNSETYTKICCKVKT